MGQFIQSPTHSTTSNVVIVTINARVATKEPTPVPKDVGAGEQIDDEKQRSGNSQCRKSGGLKRGRDKFVAH